MRYITFFLLWLLIVCSTCEKNDSKSRQKLRVKNKTDKPIYVGQSTEYPDTSLKYVTNPNNNPHLNKVPPNSIQEEFHQATTEELFEVMKIDTLMIYIFDAETIETTQWDTVVNNYLVLKRYDLSLQDLENMNWTVTYP